MFHVYVVLSSRKDSNVNASASRGLFSSRVDKFFFVRDAVEAREIGVVGNDGEAWKIGIHCIFFFFWFFFGGGFENFRELRLSWIFFPPLFDFEGLKFVRDVFTGEVCESN